MPRTVEVPDYEIVGSVSIEPATTAVIVVDMQRDFVDADGKLSVSGAADTVPAICRLIEWARSSSVPVLYTKDTHREGDPEWEIWGNHVEYGTPGWEIVDELAPRPDEIVFEKPRYDGFYATGMDHELRTRGIETLIICGTVANICVHYTAASAALRWYKVIHPVDGLSANTPFDYEAALRQADFLFNATLTTVDGITGDR